LSRGRRVAATQVRIDAGGVCAQSENAHLSLPSHKELSLHPFRVIAVPAAVAAAALVSALPAAASMQPAAGFHRPAAPAASFVRLPSPVAAVAGDLTLSVSKSKIAYKKSVTVTAHLGDTAENTTVTIYRTPSGGVPAQIASGAVDVNG